MDIHVAKDKYGGLRRRIALQRFHNVLAVLVCLLGQALCTRTLVSLDEDLRMVDECEDAHKRVAKEEAAAVGHATARHLACALVRCRSGCRVCKIATKCRSCSNTLAIDLLVLCAVRAMSGCAMTDSSIHVVLHTLCSVSSLHVSMYVGQVQVPVTEKRGSTSVPFYHVQRATCTKVQDLYLYSRANVIVSACR